MAQGLWNLYAGANLPATTSRTIGSTSAAATSGRYLASRRRKLQHELATGHVRASQLGTSDLATLGLGSHKISPNSGDDTVSGVGGLFKNLGKDIYGVAKGFFPGLWTLGKAVAHDAAPWSGPLSGDDSEVVDKVLKPVYQTYKDTYFSGNVGQKLYDHPLQPILDLATIASGGAAAASKAGKVAVKAGSNAGVAQSLASLTSRGGRAPATMRLGNTDEATVSIPREYTPRPLAHLGQQGLDKLGAKFEPLGNFQGRKALQRELKLTDVRSRGEAARAIADVGKPIADRVKDLSLPEQIALGLSLRGVNTPELLLKAQERWRQALADPEVNKRAESIGISREYRETLTRDDIGLADLIQHPTPKMVAAADAIRGDVSKGLEELPITPEQHAAHVSSYQRRLLSDDPNTPIPAADYDIQVPEGAIEPTYVPDVRAAGFEPHRSFSKLSKATGGVVKSGPLTFRRGPAERLQSTSAITSQNILAPRAQRYLHDSTGQTFDEGVFRTDPRLYVEHAAKRERDLIENGFNVNLVDKYAYRKDGEVVKFKNQEELLAAGLKPDEWVFVNPEYPIAWFRAESNFMKQAEGIIQRLQDADSQDAVVVQQMLDSITDADARAFISSHWGALKKPGVAIPRDFFEYQRQLVSTTEPFNNPAMRLYVRMMHRWRNLVLAYMPRWALNTAVGSFITNMVKGVLNPVNYVQGDRLRRSYLDPSSGETVIRPFGAKGREFDSSGLEKSEPVGVTLQEQAIAEMLEPSMGGYQQTMNIRMPTRKLVAAVQHIEDFFRRASFIHSMKQISRREPDILPGATEAMGEVLSDHYGMVASQRGSVENMLKDPVLVERALQDTNKFGYNYGALGPFERRYVRQFVPFWGWYKFISLLAYRLPVEFPGRTAAINQLALIGNDALEEVGAVPEWMKGSIVLGMKDNGVIKYMPTTGLNPFSSFANPLSPDGILEGTLSSGQLSPVLQSLLQGYGYDPLSGDSVRVSPESGVTQDFLGRLINQEGDVVSARQVAPVRRTIMSLLRSIPQIRLGEKYALEGGGSVYPESIPLIAPRPMSPASEDSYTTGSAPGDVGLSVIGLMPRSYDVRRYQQLREKRRRYNQTKRRRDLLKLKRKMEQK